MRKMLLVFGILITAVFSITAQDVDISSIQPRDLDPDLIDLSGAAFYFQGPLEIYVEGLRYGDRRYAALLDFDGDRTVEIRTPDVYGAGIRPRAIDLSQIQLRPNADGSVNIENAILDGYLFTGTVAYVDGRRLRASEDFQMLGPAPQAPADAVARIERLQAQLEASNTMIDAQNERINELRGGDTVVAELQDRLEGLRSDVEERDQRIATLRQRVTTLETRVGNLENPRVPRLPRSVHTGFEGQSTSFGDWASPAGTIRQTNAAARYAKVVYPIRQDGSEFTYRIRASVPDTGWTGYGIHFLADNAGTTRGYGYGDSYLLWLTRDPRNQTNRGYVQLYRSYDDVHMIQVAGAILPISSFDGIEATVYTNADTNEIQVFVEGRYAFTFPVENLRRRSSAVALRALGPVTFSELNVRGR